MQQPRRSPRPWPNLEKTFRNYASNCYKCHINIRPVLHSCTGKAEVKTIGCFRKKFAKRLNSPSCLSDRSPHVFNSNTFFNDCCEITVCHNKNYTYQGGNFNQCFKGWFKASFKGAIWICYGLKRCKQARKSSEDTHFTGYAQFEKVWAR